MFLVPPRRIDCLGAPQSQHKSSASHVPMRVGFRRRGAPPAPRRHSTVRPRIADVFYHPSLRFHRPCRGASRLPPWGDSPLVVKGRIFSASLTNGRLDDGCCRSAFARQRLRVTRERLFRTWRMLRGCQAPHM